jgi:hypothetical protein
MLADLSDDQYPDIPAWMTPDGPLLQSQNGTQTDFVGIIRRTDDFLVTNATVAITWIWSSWAVHATLRFNEITYDICNNPNCYLPLRPLTDNYTYPCPNNILQHSSYLLGIRLALFFLTSFLLLLSSKFLYPNHFLRQITISNMPKKNSNLPTFLLVATDVNLAKTTSPCLAQAQYSNATTSKMVLNPFFKTESAFHVPF